LYERILTELAWTNLSAWLKVCCSDLNLQNLRLLTVVLRSSFQHIIASPFWVTKKGRRRHYIFKLAIIRSCFYSRPKIRLAVSKSQAILARTWFRRCKLYLHCLVLRGDQCTDAGLHLAVLRRCSWYCTKSGEGECLRRQEQHTFACREYLVREEVDACGLA
jgi:hypothetical protein